MKAKKLYLLRKEAAEKTIQCVIFQQNNVNPYGIYSNYIELSIDFHNMIIFLGNRKI